ncbi:MAG: hypothetical protein IPN26_10480 [Bacteroidetes bacterium]|nr:hypothetical protein [Bacteroidota bacterium]
MNDHLKPNDTPKAHHHIKCQDLNDLQRELDQLNFDTDKVKLRSFFGNKDIKYWLSRIKIRSGAALPFKGQSYTLLQIP